MYNTYNIKLMKITNETVLCSARNELRRTRCTIDVDHFRQCFFPVSPLPKQTSIRTYR